jgi:hypothetical protein
MALYGFSIITFKLGVFLIHPFTNLSRAILYDHMRDIAVNSGVAEYWELGYESNPFKN